MPPEYQDSEIRPEQSERVPEQSPESTSPSPEEEHQTIEHREQASQEQARELVEKQIAHQMEHSSPSDTSHHYTDQDVKHPQKRPQHFAHWLEDLPREERVEASKEIIIEGSKSLLDVVEAFIFLKDYHSLDDLEAALSDPEIYQQLVELKRIPDLRKVK